MMYVLTQIEYNALRAEGDDRVNEMARNLQDLCTKVADHMPIVTWINDGKPTPWGCILSQSEREWYCDDCPVKEVCPHPHKRWSQ